MEDFLTFYLLLHRFLDIPSLEPLKEIQHIFGRPARGVHVREVVVLGGFTETTDDATGPVVVVLEEFAEVLDVPVMNVTIDMIHLLFGFIPSTFPCEHHHVVGRTLLTIDADVRVVLPLVVTGAMLHFFTVVVLGS